jgi:hypothetical protein
MFILSVALAEAFVCRTKLFQKPPVVFVEVADVVDAPAPSGAASL